LPFTVVFLQKEEEPKPILRNLTIITDQRDFFLSDTLTYHRDIIIDLANYFEIKFKFLQQGISLRIPAFYIITTLHFLKAD
jgi:hypothetical protein